MPEIIDDGLTGFIVEDEAGAIAAVSSLAHLSRKRVRAEFLARFTAKRMAQDDLAIYRDLAQQRGVARTVLSEAAD